METEMFKAFLKDTTAATAIEYALIATGIAIAIVTVVGTVGTKLQTAFAAIAAGI